MSQTPLHIITGEYPPDPGGVGDYSALLATALAAAGIDVHVWTTPAPGDESTPECDGVTVHRLAGRWSSADLGRLGQSLDAFDSPRRLLVQYVPNAWGYKGLNLGFCRWLLDRRRRGDEVRVMFHEVWYPWVVLDKPTRWLLAAGHRWMARILLAASTHVDVAIPAWETLLRSCGSWGRRPIGWRPVPSNIPVLDDPEGVAALRHRLAPRGETLVGSFGTFSSLITPMLVDVLPSLLASPDRLFLLIGRNGKSLTDRIVATHPELNGRLIATGGLPADDASRHLQACDLMIQPYPDGVTSRRGSTMASLAHGLPTVTNTGHLTEPIWPETGCVALAPTGRPGDLADTAEALLSDPDRRRRVASLGRDVYNRHFAIERTVEALLGREVLV